MPCVCKLYIAAGSFPRVVICIISLTWCSLQARDVNSIVPYEREEESMENEPFSIQQQYSTVKDRTFVTGRTERV